MKLKDVKWTALRFSDRTILPKDLKLMSALQKQLLLELEVERISKTRYKLATPSDNLKAP